MARRSLIVGFLLSACAALAAVGVAVAQSPTTSPSASASPTPSTTPTPPALPAVTGLRLNITGDLLDENNFPIPADQVRWMAEVTWDRASGFSGAYEVERATLPFNVFEPREYEFAGTVPTASTNAGTLRFSEPVDILRHAYCYRVTAVDPTVAGVRGPAAEVCTVRVPTTGPGAEITPGIPPTDFGPGPFPPDTGSGLIDPGDASGWTFTVIGMAAASAAAGALLAGRRRGARRS